LSILAPAQVSLGSRVHVAYVYPGSHLTTLSSGGVTVHRLRVRGNHDPRLSGQLWSLMGREQPDVVQTWLPQMDVAAGVVALARGVPWVLAERSCSDAYTARFKDRVIRRRVGQWADAVAANSRAGQTIWNETLRRGARAHVVRNALPLGPIAGTRPAQLADLGIEPGTPVAIFVGRLSADKNIPLLLAVATEVCQRSNAVFLICGDGPMRPDVEEAVRTSQVGHQIKFLGERNDVWSLMKASDVFVSTSAFEGQPNAVLEAMACGCPLVVSDIAAHREFLGPETAAIVSLSKEDFAAAILQALQRTSETRKRAEEATRRIQRHDPRSAALAYEMIYKEAALRRKRCAV
jgi:glycosyltransferase involved in cell wall biosynthesis